MPLVSIIVPVYNVEKYLRECLDSIVKQTYKNIEIILVDDGSTDGSSEICDEYAKKDERIKVIHTSNKGVAEARITGFAVSLGKYISFVDADDFVDLFFIEIMLREINNTNAEMVVCQYYQYENDTGVLTKSTVRPDVGYYNKDKIIKILSTNFLYDEYIGMAAFPPYLCVTLINRSILYTSINAQEGLSFNEDQVCMFAILMNLNSLSSIPNRLYYYRRHSSQATSIYKESIWSRIILAMQRFEELDSDNYLKNQLPDKCFIMLFADCVVKAIKAGLSNSEIKENIKKYYKELPCTNNAKFIGIKNKLKFLLVKYRQIWLLRIILLIKTKKRTTLRWFS